MKKYFILCLMFLSAGAYAQMLPPCTQDTPPGAKCYLIIEMPGAVNATPVVSASQPAEVITQPQPAAPVEVPAAEPAQNTAQKDEMVALFEKYKNEVNQKQKKEAEAPATLLRPYISGSVGMSYMEYYSDYFDSYIDDSGLNQYSGAVGLEVTRGLPLRLEAAYTKRETAYGYAYDGMNIVRGRLSSESFMANLYIDIVRPVKYFGVFVGGGYGVTNITKEISVNRGAYATILDDEKYNTLAFYAGVNAALGKNLFMDLTLSYNNVDLDGEDELYSLSSAIGLRYRF
ncbi:opacity protein-like surface antigen [Elusimicrobium posterum]|uniref:outer membrane beta-barrel protein n=1 Tax=Elusimicrobium posterum TaxID=3116653 RepID=UPI003C71C9AB